jgi:site-specific DNA recombinase
MKRRPESKSPTQIRCAIYTRKSTEEGLEQEFNSLDAQRESGEAYIASQKNEGWVCVPDRYDDGGFTGGNMDRPALKRLMADIEAGKVDCIVVYKVDRLSRSLIDFARMMEIFERKKVSFVSVTQQFNTTQSMGRLTLNILLSFAQFEREIISEFGNERRPASKSRRAFSLTDGVAESARVGRRGGGSALSPLGRRFGVAGRTAPEGPPCPGNARTLGLP